MQFSGEYMIEFWLNLNKLTEKQTTKVSMSVSCTFPLDYTVTADYPFLPQINMQVFTFNVSGHGEFSAIMQLYEDDSYQTPYNSTPEIKEEEMLNVGISLIESQVKIHHFSCHPIPLIVLFLAVFLYSKQWGVYHANTTVYQQGGAQQTRLLVVARQHDTCAVDYILHFEHNLCLTDLILTFTCQKFV